MSDTRFGTKNWKEDTMEYGRLLSRAWDIIWEHKFLILLGVLVALGGGGGGGRTATGSGVTFDRPAAEEFRIPEIRVPGVVPTAVGVIAILVVVGIIVIATVLFAISTIAKGGLIAGVNTIEERGVSSFGQAWGAGWRKGWRLVGIGILPVIPVLLLVGLAGAAALALYVGPATGVAPRTNVGLLAPVAALACILVPVAVVLGALEEFANRACMLEDRGILGSYRRGLQVLLANFGPALVLFLIQIAIGLAIVVVGILPGIVLALCCLLWPLLFLVHGAISAYLSTVWTLAWRRWTGTDQIGAQVATMAE